MTVMRAVVKGTLHNEVQVRNMFICDVVPSGGDTTEVLWTAYLDSIYDEVLQILSTGLTFQTYELQAPLGSSWETTQEVTYAKAGFSQGEVLPNAVALVLLAKASGIRHVGRKFFSGITEVTGVYNTITAGAMVTAAAALLAYITPFTGLGGGTITPGIRTAAGGFHPFVGGYVSTLLGSMRRRKPGLGI